MLKPETVFNLMNKKVMLIVLIIWLSEFDLSVRVLKDKYSSHLKTLFSFSYHVLYSVFNF